MSLICALEKIADNSTQGFVIDNIALIVIRKAGLISVYRNRCPHQGTPLDWMPGQFMDYDDVHLQCSTHGALFRVEDGQCIAGPCLGESLEALAFELLDDNLCLKAPPA